MGQVAFTVAGQVIGSYFGPVGAAIGGAIGSAVGGALFPQQLPTLEGPQLDDTRVQASTHGKAIPIVFGSARMAGNVIWSTPLRETRSETEQGGKGGGPQQSSVSYTYDVDVAIAIGEGEIDSIRRLWVNGILVWDFRAPDDPAVVATYGGDIDAILRARKGSEIGADAMAFYHGDETQLPDPTIEASEGAGNVPAYRGICYIVLTRFQLARWGNRLPQFEFEVCTSATETRGARLADEFHSTPSYRNGVSYSQSDYQPIISDIADGIRVFSANNEYVDSNVRVYGFDGLLKSADTLTDWEGGFGIVEIGQIEPQVWIMFDGARCEIDTTSLVYEVRIVSDASAISVNSYLPGVLIGGVAPCADGRHLLIFEYQDVAPYTITDWHLVKYLGNNQLSVIDSGTFTATEPSNQTRLNIGLGPIHTANGHFQTCMLESDLTHCWRTNGGTVQLWTIDATTGVMALELSTTAGDFGGTGTGDVSSTTPLTIHCDNGFCVIVAGDSPSGHWVYVFGRLVSVASAPLILGDIVAALCARVGLDPSQIDVSDLTTEVTGFVVGARMSARAAIEALMRAYNFDAAESGDQIVFRLRNASSIVTLTEDDLGASDGGAGGGQLVVSERDQENELPAEVAIRYIDVDADYQITAQAVRRMATQSVERTELALPIALTADEAAQAAEMILYQSWVGRNRRTFWTTREYSYLEPTDVVTIDIDGLSATVRITHRRQAGGLIEWSGIDVDQTTFEPNAVGASLPPPRGVSVLAPSHVHVLDIPALREDDDDAGVYVAVYHPGAGAWTGAALLSASSNDGPFTRIASVYSSATVGMATSVLGAFYGGNTFDESNTVTVRMFNSAPESATREQVLAGANVAVLGDEIIQWTTATDLGDDVYRLSGLLRGRRATERYITTGHAENERFVVLDNTLIRVPLGNGVIGSNMVYRALTFGSVEQGYVFDDVIRHAGTSVLPAPVANITGVRIEGSGVLFRWQRRDRLAWEWSDSVELPLNESIERYRVEILNVSGGVPVRVDDEVYEPEYLYQLAYELADFDVDEPQAVLNVRIYQVSASVGKGLAQDTTVTGLTNL